MKMYVYGLSFVLTGLFVVFLSSFSGDNTDYPNGAPAGYTGSPFDGKDCTQCHGGNASPVEGWITSDIPADGYIPGTNYTITVTVSGTGKKGFEVSPHDPSGNLLGTLIPGTGNKLVGGGKYVTQSSSPTTNPTIWSFTWTAPAAGTGEVTFYGAFAVSEPVTKLSTLVVQENPLVPISITVTAVPGAIYYGDSSHLNVTASGGNGNFTYSWNSIPAGFLSYEQSPWVKPVETTQYVALVSDGVQTVADTVEVTVFPLGLATQPPAFDLSVHPNPTTGRIHVSSDKPLNAVSVMKIYDIRGRLVLKMENLCIGSPEGIDVDLTGENPGLYFIHIISESSEFVKRLIIQP